MPHPIAVVTVVACLSAVPDVIPSGLRGVRVEQVVDFGPHADRVVVQCALVAGDTIEKIAVRVYGDRAKAAAILALNPNLEPNRLETGQTIWLPARKPGDAGALFVFVAPVGPGTRGQSAPPRPCVVGQLPFSRTGSYRFLLVPEKHRTAFEASLDGEAKSKLLDEVAKQIVEAHGTFHGRYVNEESAVRRIVSTVTFVRDGQGKVSTTTKNLSYDKDGKEVAADARGDDGPGPKKGELLLVLGLLAGGWLTLRGRGARQLPQVG